ncbi:GTP 3',8-cyclase MoaA [Imhoffiella purpurea]|uniref:GTP 3',8-cyclase n=1 Tax=Imhoffiella purpurea TaxID=1249627 RepID=W9W0X1_9GAMM|nr:GTP 3',8-cyclase MoaA [Imhoffiella purpurea]EXJ16250.1 Molybdenum cofactor biosynthesis protein MoaA [Imhoffiella purpurea]
MTQAARHSTEGKSVLIDRFGRRIDYVRLSITDRCDLRCLYCMSDDMSFLPRNQLLTLEEMARLGRCFGELGVSRIRITGGEPLVRRNAIWLFEQLGGLPSISDLALTTNGTQLSRHARALKDAGVTRINISLDSLDPGRFKRITRLGDIRKTLAGIEAAVRCGFERIKLNSVILKHRNHDEVLDLTRFAIDRGIDLSFIEEMPLGFIGDHDRAEAYYSSDAIRHDLQREFDLLPSTVTTGGPSKYYRIAGTETRVGFISPHSHSFCEHCNRVRVTAEGRLLLCLGHEDSADLRRALRANPCDDAPVKQAIIAAMEIKPRGHDFGRPGHAPISRHMNVSGG